jgi:hypothetical protein
MSAPTPLSDAEKTDIRRHCGYAVATSVATGGQSWFYFQQSGLLEIRMNALAATEIGIVRRYLAALTTLELAVPHAGDSLDTDQAAVWTRNRSEPQDRLALFDTWRRRLCAFLGLAPGPYFPTSATRIIV